MSDGLLEMIVSGRFQLNVLGCMSDEINNNMPLVHVAMHLNI